jgi:penicillin-binding protein 1A
MKTALAGKPQKQLNRPKGLVTVKINAETGELATDQDKDTIFEIFRAETVPGAVSAVTENPASTGDQGNPIPEQLF